MTHRRVLSRTLSTTVGTLALTVSLTAAMLSAAGPASAAPSTSVPTTRAASPTLSWTDVATGSTARFRGLSVVSDEVVWLGGYNGTVLRSVDSGAHWTSVGPSAAADLQFRDIEAMSEDHAVALTIGPGEDSRVYVTVDGGRSWSESFRNTDANAFYDCLAFFDAKRGIAVSDPPDGKARIIATVDGGRSWRVVDNAGMPPALAGEFYFAASGTCLRAGKGRTAYLATGGGAEARVLTSTDWGRTWTAASTPLASSDSAGIFSVDFRTPREGIVVGGDFLAPTTAGGNAAYTTDGGRTWLEPSAFPAGYRSGLSWMPGWRAALAVGPSGTDVTWDGGRSWSVVDSGSFDAVECGEHVCWASGAGGRVGKLPVPER